MASSLNYFLRALLRVVLQQRKIIECMLCIMVAHIYVRMRVFGIGGCCAGDPQPTDHPIDQLTDFPTDAWARRSEWYTKGSQGEKETGRGSNLIKNLPEVVFAPCKNDVWGYRQTLSSTRTRLRQTGAGYYLMFAGFRSWGQGGARGRRGSVGGTHVYTYLYTNLET